MSDGSGGLDVWKSLIIVLIGTLSGIIISTLISHVKEENRLRKDVDKTKTLLAKDFCDINKLIFFQFRHITEQLFSLNEIIPEIVDGEYDYAQITGTYMRRYPFVFWNSIVTSAALIKLDKGEIELVQRAHDLIEEHNTHIIPHRDDLLHRLMDYLQSTDPRQEKIHTLNEVLSNVLLESMNMQFELYARLRMLDKLPWIVLDRFSELEPQPVGMEPQEEWVVDHKGTYWKREK
ncbi:MAG: hypothetical protein QXY90_04730 [Candidatus Anstonellales archaeon]